MSIIDDPRPGLLGIIRRRIEAVVLRVIGVPWMVFRAVKPEVRVVVAISTVGTEIVVNPSDIHNEFSLSKGRKWRKDRYRSSLKIRVTFGFLLATGGTSL